jgi:ATP-dependent DNA ligase
VEREVIAAAIPEWIEPMKATLTQERFAGADWIFERKYDGIRLIAFKNGPVVRLFSRNHLPQTLPRIADAIAQLPANTLILDGEADWSGDVGYHVFDVLWIDGRDVRAEPLESRQAILSQLPLRSPLAQVRPLADEKPWDRACREGWEGVIAKRRGSVYESKRSPHWLKMKCEATAEFTVGGFTDPQGSRVGLGALLVGQFQDGEFVFSGKVGTGFDTALLLALRARLEALEISKPPFTAGKGLPRLRAHWVRPEVVVRVAFIEWTAHRKLRHSRLLAVVS